MSTARPFLHAFGPLVTEGSALRALGQVKRLEPFEDLYALFGHLFEAELLAVAPAGVVRRQRVFTPQVTFWAFVAQVLSPASPCREVVQRVQAWWVRTVPQAARLSASTSAYCQARARLDLDTLELIAQQVAWSVERHVLGPERWLGRTVKVVDGTGLSMPDTPENQARWPQPSGQKVGCGFPAMKLVGLFSLASGALLAHVTGNQHRHESVLFRALWDKLRRGDVVLADRGFCSFATLATLGRRGVDCVLRLHQARPVDVCQGEALGPDDRLVTWTKPTRCPDGCPAEEYAALPDALAVRQIQLHVTAKGFRPRTVVLVTTLLDAGLYPAEALRELYGQRWQVELHFDQIKTVLAMDVLRCKSPELIFCEVVLHAIAYNLVRSLMQQSAQRHHVPLSRLSFKGALDAARQWAGVIAAAGRNVRKQQALLHALLAVLARDLVRERPGRSEPRARKRRSRTHDLLSHPRHPTQTVPPVPHSPTPLTSQKPLS
jgi:hypothetical protein